MDYINVVLENINWLAVFVAALANFFIGALWFSPIMFAKPWMQEVYGTTDPTTIKQKTHMGITMGTAFLMTFVTAIGLAMLVYLPGDSLQQKQQMIWGLGVSSILSLLIIGANMYKHYQFEQRSFKLAFINGSHDFVCFIVMGLIMSCWR